MIRIGLQFFAHKKGVGSTKNGRDSMCWPATFWFVSAAPISTPA